jgi:glycosyltransferase involved in cell wall biosynthesis
VTNAGLGAPTTAAGGKRPRVVLLVENLPVPMDRRTWQEAGTLARAGWDVTVIGPMGEGDMARRRDRIDGIEVLRYPQRAASGLAGYLAEYLPSMAWTAAWLAWTRSRGPIAVIHGCNPPDLFWVFGALAGLRGTRYVFDEHDANPELSLTKFGDRGLKARLLHRFTLAMERWSYRTAALVLAPNDSYAALARGRGHVPDERVVVVRNAPDVTAYRAHAAGIEPEGQRVGYVGVMGSQDGIEILIEAWATVIAQPDLAEAVLELVGDGEERPNLERQVEALGLGERVRFRGYLRAADFVPILARTRLTVSPDPPTPFNDVSTMVKVLDSLVIGRPVVAFDLQETRLLLGDGGVIVEEPTAAALAAELIRLLRDPAATDRLAAAAAVRPEALRMGWDQSAAALVAAYAGLLPHLAAAPADPSA